MILILGSALSPLSINTVLFAVTGAMSPIIVNVYTNGSVYTNGCYRPILFGTDRFLKEFFFEKVNFENKLAEDKKSMQNPEIARSLALPIILKMQVLIMLT